MINTHSLVLLAAMVSSAAAAEKPTRSGTVAVGDSINMYYEIHGEGPPLVLLHGAYMSIDMNYGQLIPELKKSRQVIAVELQGHYRTNDSPRPLSYEHLAHDVATLLGELIIPRADILGYSFGGTVAIDFAIRYPDLVSHLIVISSTYKHEGWSQDVRDVLETITPAMLAQTPLKSEYDRLAPDPEHWEQFILKFAKFDVQPFDVGVEQIEKMKAPLLLIAGDNDGLDDRFLHELYRRAGGGVFGDIKGLPKSRLAIYPGTTHQGVMAQTSRLVSDIESFLNQDRE